MKLTKVTNPVSGDPVTYNPQNLTITTGYDTWHAVPAEYTKVAQYKASSADRPQNPTTNSDTNSTTNAGMYSYGNYYTLAAAIADTTNYITNNQSIANTSICPTVGNNYNVYGLFIFGSVVYPDASFASKDLGESIRCAFSAV